MPVSETRLAVRLEDAASQGLKSLTSTYSRFSNTIKNSGNSLAQFNRQANAVNFGGFATNASQAANSLSNMNKMMERLVYSASRYLVIYKALSSVGNVWDALVGGSYEYAKSLETNQIGIAGILKSMITLNGEQVQWNDAMAISGKAMKSLQSEALRTAATSKELIETFRALLGPGLSSGMSIDQIVQLSTVGTNAVRSLGLPTNQYVQELRSIITEGIRPASSTLATSLGITNKDIKEAKASTEGLFNFLMKRMQGFSDAVKYTSGTVEGRIARIQEGLNVAGAKGAEALYQSWSNVLEKIANYLIPIPEKLGDKWEINPAFVKSIERVANTVGKIAEGLADTGSAVSPFVGGALGTGLTVLDQIADKLKYIFGFFTAKALAPYVADIAKIAFNSREAYEAQTALGRAIQGVSDKISGRIAELQRLIAEQNIYNASVDAYIATVNQANAINAMVSSNANSVTNLATKWQRMGMSAKEAGVAQNAVLQEIQNGNERLAQIIIKQTDAKAAEIEATKQYEAAVKRAYDTELQAIRQVIKEQNSKKLSDKEKVTKFLGKDIDKNVYKWQIDSTNELITKLQQLGLEEEKVYNLAVQYTNALKRGGQEAASAISNQIVLSAQNFIAKQKTLTQKQEEIVLDNKVALEQSALANAYRQGGEAAYQALTKIIEEEKRLVAEMQKRGLVTTEVEERHIQLLNQVVSAKGKETGAIIKNTQAVMENEKAQLGANSAKQKAVQAATTMISTIGTLSMGIGILCDVLQQADEKNKEWYQSAGDAAMTAGMLAIAISSITPVLSEMTSALQTAVRWLKEFSLAKTVAGFGGIGAVGIGGAALAVAGAAIYSGKKQYEAYKNGRGTASAIDDFTGEEIKYDYNSRSKYAYDYDDAGNLAVINKSDINYGEPKQATGEIGLNYTPGGGGSKGGGGSSKANKAEEYAERMKKIVADLNKEMTNMRGNATAYEKAMASAEDKIASYNKDIVKAEQLGVDVGEVRKAQADYILAARKKALELQEDENLKLMKLEEEQAQRMNVLGQGTMDQQRAVYAERLEAHRTYLNELLAQEIDNKERRYQLEAELANVTKQIRENSVYEFKSGWAEALDELANRQINFKDSFVSAFDSIEGSMVSLISGTESAKDKFKKFCEEVTNTILKSMAQIIIRGLITKAIMGAIGLGGGTSIPGGTGALGSINDTWASGGFAGFGKASGGIVQKGGTYVVGENGPELLQMGSSGKVYNSRETKSMLNGGVENVKVEIINKSNNEVKASDASVRFDGKTMIVSTVIDAVSTNYMGIQSMFKGMARGTT